MIRVYTFAFLCILFFSSQAQTFIATDTAFTGSGNSQMTFYSTVTGAKTTVANDDWHLALSVRASQFPTNTLQGTTIRINGGMGVRVFQVPGFTADSSNVAVDTAGYTGWQQLVDSDTALDEGALNTGRNIAVFNYGWGFYGGSPNHDVVGNKVYLIETPGGILKKFWVEELDRDTAWVVKSANPDNSNLQMARISKRDYAGKNFVYLDLHTNVVHDKEPLSASWDLVFLKYAANNYDPGSSTPIVGVLANKGVKIAKRDHSPLFSNNYSGLTFSSNMNTIGWDWKYFRHNNITLSGKDIVEPISGYKVKDSLSYFVQNQQGVVTKIIFTDYTGVLTGQISFYKETITSTGISEATENIALSLYPNPCNSFLNIDLRDETISSVQVIDLSGKILSELKSSESILQLNTSELSSGVYLLAVHSEKGTAVRRFAVVN